MSLYKIFETLRRMADFRHKGARGVRFTLALPMSVFAVIVAGPLGMSPAAADTDTVAIAAQDQDEASVVAILSTETAPLDRISKLPRVLSAADVLRYRQIFSLQEAGRWTEADALIRQLEKDLLMGHVLFQRYMHPTAYRSKFSELAAWLEEYGDHPGAKRIYRLAERRRPHANAAITEPVAGYLNGHGEDILNPQRPLPSLKLQRSQKRIVQELKTKIRDLIRRGGPTAAARVLARRELKDWLTDAEWDSLRSSIGRSYFAVGKDRKALELAGRSARRSGDLLPGSHWVAGLAAWRLNDLDAAKEHFTYLAEADVRDDYLRAGGAYWAARVNAKAKEPLATDRMLRIAAEYPRTIYGLLARRSLGMEIGFDWDNIRLLGGDVQLLKRAPGAMRATALSEVERFDLAEKELRKLYPQSGRGLRRALLSLADQLDLPALQIRIASRMAIADGRYHIDGLYPAPRWPLDDAIDVDRALIYALVRRESWFDPRAKSNRGARGLMQLMPRTATYIADSKQFRGDGADALYEPEVNLALGQKYVRYLLDRREIGGNLLYALAAYNSGPGNLRKWLKEVRHGEDPLLFIESLPVLETRLFIRQVLTNLWIYRDQLSQQAPTLDALAAGRWPKYISQEGPSRVADNARN